MTSKCLSIAFLILSLPTVTLAEPNAMELLDKFAETVDKSHTSFITQSKLTYSTDEKYSGGWAQYSGLRDKNFLKEFRTDGKRYKQITQKWGNFATADRSEDQKGYGSLTYDGNMKYQYSPSGVGSLIITSNEPNYTVENSLAWGDGISQSFGYFTVDNVRFDRLLKSSGRNKIIVQEQMEDVNGAANYVIEAKTRNGLYKIWLNPEKGYNFSKAEVVKKAGHLFRGNYKVEAGCERKFFIENTDFKKIDGIWVPVKAKTRIDETHPRGSYIRINGEMELTSIAINPDHEALRSFSLDDIKNGSRVMIQGRTMGKIKYSWQDGKVVDDKGKVIKNIKADK